MSRQNQSVPFSNPLISHLRQLLLDLHHHPAPTLPNPSQVRYRASVAVLLRIRPRNVDLPVRQPYEGYQGQLVSISDHITTFFSQAWVQAGDPEIFFIKRASNKHDNWSGHIAFPGGMRDPTDSSDQATAIRETKEEIGLDLSRSNPAFVMPAGGLPQMLIATSWNDKPLMVYCPFVFLLGSPNLPQLDLQPQEVASAHWIPIHSIFDRSCHAYWTRNASWPFLHSGSGIVPTVRRLLSGQMIFGAVQLNPSHSSSKSISSSSSPAVETAPSSESGIPTSAFKPTAMTTTPLLFPCARMTNSNGAELRRDSQNPLLLWGVTLLVVRDFLFMLPPHQDSMPFIYPTFTALDSRLILFALSYRYRTRHSREAEETVRQVFLPRFSPVSAFLVDWAPSGGVPQRRYYGRIWAELVGKRGELIQNLMAGYYPMIHQAVIISLVLRIIVVTALLAAFTVIGFFLLRTS